MNCVKNQINFALFTVLQNNNLADKGCCFLLQQKPVLKANYTPQLISGSQFYDYF